ncbi:AfsR/SARP family transcriptional regulator [Gordonia hankookensis]|uniref:Bacterial transcriptional activator domain-containing protein n=1 Tax=Gordonia hankookensis TaxID=589403 RepID=A0ABR7W759_9ACTN|nr:bacterial transcriptional activator domain-containing protein [Gordonia hankookensis]MBD1318653.1 hypothetical protein [Gordonia hankookensis]
MIGGEPAEVTVEFRLFGRFVALTHGREVPPAEFGGRKVRQLVRILLTRRGGHISTDALAEMLWPARMPRDPAANLAVLAARARRAIGARDLIVSGDAGYRSGLTEQRCRVDTHDFVSLVTASRTADNAPALGACRRALALWTGDPLCEDQCAMWAVEYRDLLSQYRIEALERGIGLCLERFDTAQAIEWASSAMSVAPLRERSVVLAMRSFAAHGDRCRALDLYDHFRRELSAELGVDPSPSAVETFDGLLRSARSEETQWRSVRRPQDTTRAPF